MNLKAVFDSEPAMFNSFLKEFNKPYPKMTVVNRMLQNDNAWEAVKKFYQISSECQLPHFENQLLYGCISDFVYNPDLDSIVVSNLSSEKFKTFFKELGRVVLLSYSEFDEELSENIPQENDEKL